MNSTPLDLDTLQKEAELLPGNLIQAMAERDGPAEGGLTLTREHIVTLNQYANYTFQLPVAKDAVIRWLGYSTIQEPDLMPSKMEAMHKQLQKHGRCWTVLADNSKKLGFELAASANGINTTGDEILEILENSRALGRHRDAWETLKFEKALRLGADDRRRVLDLVDYMEVLREDVDLFARRVNAVREETEQFRDTAREQLIPLVAVKSQALKRQKASGAVQQLREDLAELDNEIKRLEAEYDQYVKAALSGLAAGPLGAAITGGIYGSKAAKVRKERNKLQGQRAALSQKIKESVRLEGLVEELGTQMGQLDTRLRDVVTASSHLQSAWQLIGVYIDTSIEHLQRIETNQALFKFSIFFKRFIGQWKDIEKFAQHMNRVFDDAAAAK
ncbi:alpha-xenorhabdolysin family binary toxin subunit A [Pseudomonas rubra]|uniref:Alpha-xenorhabdolysin family binary toxin subunit A n=1 Tax=Pseudomonas rubra TaxID=2942627 RepID=A0ABT5PC24_9PSED|nr:alpha-xenorhabdolysin family binary toxin subunit A [Pseudomonas rubra]MDD1015851.1 alpha-xenorhabdolysin family binary toxin subunit A [Pseudomonas rubra]MDD1036774.1 alpha-xenorhabdolysin family binary toxin subunit A [Pseudomonas rubra]MDD1157259.1 alpha-xenorhabdolysin family binary toxin subunit A [Pseudomonas rubra]